MFIEDSNQASVYFQLGKDQEQEGNIEEAIASYLEAVKLSLGNLYYCQGLSEALIKINQPHHWEQAITIYRRIISENPNSIWGIYFLGFSLQNTQQFEAACQSYQNTISINPDFFWAYFSLGNCAKEMQQWEEAIIAYQRALELNPGYTSLNSDIAEAYYQLGKKYIEQNQLEEAAQCYQKALEKQHYQKLAYYDLKEMIAKSFYKLGLQNAETGKLSEGIKCFEDVSLMQTKGDIYDHIWRGLNSLGFLDEASFCCDIEIRRETVEAYFANTSSYRIISLWDVTADDKDFLKQLGLSITNLEIISKDNIFLEDIYINHFSSAKIQLKRKVARNPQYIAQWFEHTGMYLEQSIIETGYVHAVCPISGRVIRSNQSFFVFPSFFYRFVGDEVFYLLVGEWCNARYCVYFPRWDLIIKFYHAPYTNCDTISSFKAYSVTNWQSFKSYISTPKKQVAPIIGDLFNNLTHYMWDLAGFQYLDDNNLLDKIDKVLVGPYDFFNVGDLFPEIAKDKIEVFDSSLDLYKSIIENNYCAVKLVECFIQEKLADRIYQASLKKCSKLFLEEVEQSTQNFPVLWITIRSSRRIWTSQVQGIANIIKKLSVDFPNLSIIFDGWSRTEKSSKNDEVSIAIEIAMMEQIIAMIPPEINTHNAIGRMTYEKAVWVHAIDLHISSLGAGMCFVVWLVNKPGVAHGNTFFTQAETHQGTAFPSCRENATEPLVSLPLDKITDEDNSFWGTRNYDCDWNAIYDEVVKIINGLSKKDKKTGIN